MTPLRVLIPLCLVTSAAAQTLVFRKVVLQGDPAPGMPGLSFGEIGAPAAFGELAALPSIDKRGDVAFHAFAGPNPTMTSPDGIWRELDGVIELVVQGGEPAPGTPFNFVGFPVVGSTPSMSQGRITFLGGVVNSQNQFQTGLWSDRFGPLELVLFDTDHLPGTPSNTQVFDFTSALREEHVLINARYESGPFVGQDHEGIWRDSTGVFEVVVVDGMSAPGFPPGAVFGSDDSITFNHPIHFWGANKRGEVVFNAYAEGGGVSTMGFDDEGVWVDAESGLQLIVREGDLASAVSPSARFGALNGIDSFGNQDFSHADLPVAIGDSGAIVFGAAVRDTSYERRPTVWTNRSGAIELLLLGSTNSMPAGHDGSPAPGYPAGSGFLDFESCFALLNSADEIAMTANVITTSPVTITRAIYWDHPGTLTLVARVLGSVPDLPGASFDFVQLSTFSDSAVLWYSGVISGPGISSSNDFAVFRVLPDGQQRLVLREGDVFDVHGDGSDLRTVRTFGIGPGQTPAGERVFEILFTDGTHGVFTARETCIPVAYCAAKTNSLGCLPAMDSSGLPSASAASGFVVRAKNVRNQKSGLLIYGVNGQDSTPFQGGTLCVAAPIKRAPATSSLGTPLPTNDCTGIYSIDMNAFASGALGGAPLPALQVVGTLVDCQWWGRDPGFPAPNNTTLSDGLEYGVCP